MLTDARRFEHIVVSATGRMALMPTIDPRVFVEFKTWLATEASDRPAIKRRRDGQQAAIVQTLLDESLLIACTRSGRKVSIWGLTWRPAATSLEISLLTMPATHSIV
jgi:hypothetical protein